MRSADTQEQPTDDNGHGTHCAGIIAGATVGVCKLATVVAVKVLDAGGSGSLSGVIAGLNWGTYPLLVIIGLC